MSRGKKGNGRFAYLEYGGAVDYAFDWWHQGRAFLRQSLDTASVGDVAFEYDDSSAEKFHFMDRVPHIGVVKPAARGKDDILGPLPN